jgi:hypothetical protein
MDNDKFLSGEEKRAKLKEQYKNELLLKKQFLDKLESRRHINNINNALEKMLKIGTDDMDLEIEKLNAESALAAAKLELALQENYKNLDTQEREKYNAPQNQTSNNSKTLGDSENRFKDEVRNEKKTLGDWES